jgi:PAS domain S-box-containing protein
MDSHLLSLPEPQNIFFRCVEDASEAIMITSVDGVLIYVNPFWSKIYGYEKEEAVGKKPSILHSGLHDSVFYQKMWESIRGQGLWKGNIVNRASNGNLVPVYLTITPYKDEKGNILGYMGIALDISTIRKLEAKVRHQERLASVGTLASGVAHEIGTPLGIIRGRAEMLYMATPDDSSGKKWLDTIIKQIDRISSLINTLLNLSRSGESQHLSLVPVKETFQEVSILVESKLSARNISLSLNIPEGTFVYATHSYLQQIFLNLLVNAVQAIEMMPPSEDSVPHQICVESRVLSEPHPHCEIRVSDTGCGIAPEHIPRLFHAFFTTKDINKGTGLGLNIVAELLASLGGGIRVESQLHKGTCFIFTLPTKTVPFSGSLTDVSQ